MLFDHLVVGATALDEARAYVEEALGVSMQPGGAHAVFQTHNALMGLADGIYLEAIAPNPGVPPPARPRWYDLDRFEGLARLSNWACSVPDLEDALRRMPAGSGDPVAVRRGELSWRMAVSPDGTTPYDSLRPAAIEWPAGVHPAAKLEPTGVRERRMTLSHPRAVALAEARKTHLTDDRVAVEAGPAALVAEFDTPHGPRTL